MMFETSAVERGTMKNRKRVTRGRTRGPSRRRSERNPASEAGTAQLENLPDTEPREPVATVHRRVRAGELYYVKDAAASEGWSIVEIAGADDVDLAAFAIGQLEAMPLAEIEARILGPVPTPAPRSGLRAA